VGGQKLPAGRPFVGNVLFLFAQLPALMYTHTYPNLIFDLGGVIINLDFARMTRLFDQLAGKSFADIYAHHQQLHFFDDFETGRISPAEFREQVRQILGLDSAQAPDHVIDHHWNAILLDIPAERVAMLQRLGRQKRIFLLSNTNAIHKAAFDQIVQEQHGLPGIDELFEKAYYSHLVHDRKPSPTIFQRVLDENGLDPAQTLFIDDTARHIEGAKTVGLHTLHLVAPTTILDVFSA
jgi:glucose-1-phosphatase